MGNAAQEEWEEALKAIQRVIEMASTYKTASQFTLSDARNALKYIRASAVHESLCQKCFGKMEPHGQCSQCGEYPTEPERCGECGITLKEHCILTHPFKFQNINVGTR